VKTDGSSAQIRSASSRVSTYTKLRPSKHLMTYIILVGFYGLRSLNREPPIDNLTRADNRVDDDGSDAPGRGALLVEDALVRESLELLGVRGGEHLIYRRLHPLIDVLGILDNLSHLLETLFQAPQEYECVRADHSHENH